MDLLEQVDQPQFEYTRTYIKKTRPDPKAPRGVYSMKRAVVVQPDDELTRIIALTRDQQVFVSAHRYDALMRFNWHALWSPDKDCYYAVRNCEPVNGASRLVFMHREILGLGRSIKTDPRIGDHIDRNSLNNRDTNLRAVDKSGSILNQGLRATNTSGYIGVNRVKGWGKWRARITVNGKRVLVGDYDTAIEAALARDVAAYEAHGELAVLNFPRT